LSRHAAHFRRHAFRRHVFDAAIIRHCFRHVISFASAADAAFSLFAGLPLPCQRRSCRSLIAIISIAFAFAFAFDLRHFERLMPDILFRCPLFFAAATLASAAADDIYADADALRRLPFSRYDAYAFSFLLRHFDDFADF
jgi:hypothetical protein